MKLKFIECDRVNANGRMYPKKEVEKAIEDIQDDVSKMRFFVQKELSMSHNVNLDDVIGLVKEVTLEDNVGYCEIKLFDFLPEERKEFLTQGLDNGDIQVVSSAIGNVEENGIIRDLKFNFLFLTTESAWN